LLAQPDDPGASGSPDRLDGSGHRRHAAPGPPIRPGHPVKKAWNRAGRAGSTSPRTAS